MQFLKKLDSDIIRQEFPSLSTDGADKTTIEPLTFVELEAVMTVTCHPLWRPVVNRQTVRSRVYKLCF